MLWTVAHQWPKASRFAFNCYKHFLQLIIRVPGDRTPNIILSKEGVTQGDPMAMPLYGISVAVLAEQLKRIFPSPMKVWYADDFSATDSGRVARPLMKRLGEIRPLRGGLPRAHKVTVHPTSPDRRRSLQSSHQEYYHTARGWSTDTGRTHRLPRNSRRLDHHTCE